MASNNRGRSTTGEAAVPYYLGTPAQEAAKHLRLTVTRYLADRASLREIEEAMAMLRDAAKTTAAAKLCGVCARQGRARFICRTCKAPCCEHRCSNKAAPQTKGSAVEATCTSCGLHTTPTQ